MKVQKQIHWDTRAFHQFLIDRANMPFEWGKNDCSTFAADGILAMSGVDIASDFRGLYDDEQSAQKAIETITGIEYGTIEDAAQYCANKYGLEEWKFPLMAKRGDLVVINESGRLVAGLVHLDGRHVLVPGENSLKKVSITNIKRAWHIPIEA